MADITYSEISSKVDELAMLLHEHGYAYSSGYMTTLVTFFIASYVPQANRQLVLEDIQGHIDSQMNRKQEVA